MTKFRKIPWCEACGENRATAFVFIKKENNRKEGRWHFCCECTAKYEHYYIEFDDYFSMMFRFHSIAEVMAA